MTIAWTFFWLLAVVVIGIPIYLSYRTYRRKESKDLIKALITAEKASIKYHYFATGLNAAGLALGIGLVFYCGLFGEGWITLGVAVTILSIIAYCLFELAAALADMQVSEQSVTYLGKPAPSDWTAPAPTGLLLEKAYITLQTAVSGPPSSPAHAAQEKSADRGSGGAT